jgi:DNA polymerase-3 subunit epsilon
MSKMRKLVVIDTETGGLDPSEHSILSLAAVVWVDGAIEGKFQVVVHEPNMSVTLEALRINGFTKEILETEGVSPVTAAHDLRSRVTLAGHNVGFDLGFLKRLYRLAGMSTKEYESRFSHRALCTQTLALALEAAGRCDFKSTGLNGLCEYFGIAIREGGARGRHDALEDATATAKLLTKELALIRDPRKDAPGTSVQAAPGVEPQN